MFIKPLSDTHKILIAQKRDEKVFKAYFIANYKVFEQYAFSLLKDRHFAEDTASEVLWKVWHLEQDLMHIASVERYIFRSIKNKCLNLLRVKKMVYYNYEDLRDKLVEEVDPEQLMISKESLIKIESAIAGLPTKTKQAFKLIKEQQCSYKDAAQIMDISVNTVDRHIQIALDKLWQILKKKK